MTQSYHSPFYPETTKQLGADSVSGQIPVPRPGAPANPSEGVEPGYLVLDRARDGIVVREHR